MAVENFKPKPTGRSKLEEIEASGELSDYMNKMTLIAYKHVKRYSNRFDRSLTEDIALEAYLRIFAGRRIWQPDLCPNFDDFTAGVVRSLVTDYVRRADNKVEHAEDGDIAKAADAAANSSGNVISLSEHAQDDAYELKCFASRLRKEFRRHGEIFEQMFELRYDYGIERPKEFSVALDLPVAQVNNYIKRYNRIAPKVFKKAQGE